MARRKRRKFTPQFKADAVRLVTTGAKTIAAVTEEFDLTETALRAWVKRAEADEGKGTRETLTTAERSELIDLRKRLKRAEMERDILKKATAKSIGQGNRFKKTFRGRNIRERFAWSTIQKSCDFVQVGL